MKTKEYLINLILSNSGSSMSTKEYRATLANMGYNRYQQAGSVGGSSGRSATVAFGHITRN